MEDHSKGENETPGEVGKEGKKEEPGGERRKEPFQPTRSGVSM